MKPGSFLALVALFATVPTLADENFRCGKWIASSDMTPAELAEKCGPPTLHESRTEDVMVRNRNTGLMQKIGEARIETWIYDRGTQAAPMVVTIVDGRIKSIDRQEK
jgi:hypothetical protein